MEKYLEDVRQDEKHVPDLLESIMRPTDPVKEELRRILFQMGQFRPKIEENIVALFGCPEKSRIPPEAACRSKVGCF